MCWKELFIHAVVDAENLFNGPIEKIKNGCVMECYNKADVD